MANTLCLFVKEHHVGSLCLISPSTIGFYIFDYRNDMSNLYFRFKPTGYLNRGLCMCSFVLFDICPIF